MKERIAVLAFNDVQSELHGELIKRGYDCKKVDSGNTELLKKYLRGIGTVVLPFPSKKKNISFLNAESVNLNELISKEQLVIGGMIDNEVRQELEEAEINYADYFSHEPYVLKNAYLTTQGVLKLLFENTKDFLPCKTALVTGFGRIGKSLAVSLKKLGLKVFVAVRSELQTAEAQSMGFDVIKIPSVKSTLFYFDFIFNTVPCNIFSEEDVMHFKDEAVYFEIASSPFGAEKEHFDLYGKSYVFASALPGKFYPKAVASNICDFICGSSLLKQGREV